MIKQFIYIVLLIAFSLWLTAGTTTAKNSPPAFYRHSVSLMPDNALQQQRDTTANKKQHPTEEEKKKIKEIAKAKKMPKPEKVEEVKVKPKRQRRPDGLERPPEIPRRNNN
ncbi:hypothetical protein FPZ43_07310 [Mucilaginibacter pallidiroseus]|uniref:Uncharacterized protein n=1 Tax=Mucilaginibacter pallidiroseus TaxID=2599295 RepID=A0A563UE71_9SPHI|nr:hypothetical protein [Mucilaginibacter pallidiroseus]TWR29662.1 hypothetical protein FPZ43_07310 [Mucilaginibacter pallidiroseus]